MSARLRAPKPIVKYRIVCAAHGIDTAHRSHAYSKPDRTKAAKSVAQNNTQPYAQPVDEVVPAHRACFPYRIEATVVCPWENPDDAEELAAMLIRDWWDWGGEVPPMTVAFA